MSLRIDEPSGADPQLFSSGSAVTYLPGLREPSSGLVDPVTSSDDPSDWIELYNNGEEAVNLGGWSLSDDLMEPLKWSFPVGTTISAGEYLVVLADDPDNPVEGGDFLHTNFKLASGGEYVGLYDSGGNPVSEISPKYPRQFPNYSYGLTAGWAMAIFSDALVRDSQIWEMSSLGKLMLLILVKREAFMTARSRCRSLR